MRLQSALVLIFSMFLMSVVYGQQVATDKVWEIMKLNKTKELVESVTKTYLAKFKRDNPNVSQAKWAEIEKSINHDNFLKSVYNVYRSQYGENELDKMLNALKSGDQNTYQALSKKTEKQVYEMGKSYGSTISQMIFSKIKQG